MGAGVVDGDEGAGALVHALAARAIAVTATRIRFTGDYDVLIVALHAPP